MMKNQRGFTLIELAIVLVIIGLLLGGVLKGQELITQAKIKNVSNDINGTIVAIYGYQDRYKRLPGDDPGRTRWSVGGAALAAGDGDNTIDGVYESNDPLVESRKFWLDLRMAGFIAGDTSTVAAGSTQPLNAANGILGVQHGGLGLVGTVVCAGSLPTKIAQSLDSQMDDGNATTGSVRASLEGNAPPTAVGAAAPGANYIDDGDNLYVLCKNI